MCFFPYLCCSKKHFFLDMAKKGDIRYAATGMLLVAMVVFIIARMLEHTYPAMGYIRAFAEAAMVGGLADWFAVVALFQHPLGIPIPHTNLIKLKQTDFAAGLGHFVVENFLNEQSIMVHLDKVRFSDEIVEFITKQQSPRKLARQLAQHVPSVLDNLDDEETNKFIESNLRGVIENIDSANILSKMLEYLIEKDLHQHLLADILDIADQYVHQEVVETRILEEIRKQREWYWPPSQMITEKIVDVLRTQISDIQGNPQHEMRYKLNGFIENFIDQLKNSPDYQKAAENIKLSLLNNTAFATYSQQVWSDVKKVIERDITSEGSRIERSLEKALTYMTDKLQTDTRLQDLINQTLKREALYAICDMREEIAGHISQTVAGWTDIADRINQEVGNDLQFIRINGTLVGGSIGLLLYTIFEKLLPYLGVL